MNVLVTGATGFVGRALLPRLGQAGHSVTALVRSKERAGDLGVALAQGQAELREAMGRADGVVNLAGESVLPRRWTPDRKRALVESRVETSRALVEAIRQSEQRPRVMLSASAVGYYGDRGEELQSEDQPSGDDFLARLCVQWEAAAREAMMTVESTRPISALCTPSP